ncbi:hypothetical protein F66182_274 [Fusarium sp. NRRL 66182]|nr:hypothetical protein F66182_274 [Fusarium sp. NRRL 66182]
MDVTASTINRTSPLDLNFAKLSPLLRPGSPHDSVDKSTHLSSDLSIPLQTPGDDRTGPRFSSNAAIIEHYSHSWNNQEPRSGIPLSTNVNFEQLIGSRTGHAPRWPFINDDSLKTPDSIEAEPLFPAPCNPTTHPRQCHRIDEDLGSLAAQYVPPFEAASESPHVEALPIRPPIPRRRNRVKVMTSAEFEALQRQKDREDAEKCFYGVEQEEEEEEEDNKMDYEWDEVDGLKEQRMQRKKQQAHLDGYRQQMMKTTKGYEPPVFGSHSRVPSAWSIKSFKTFQSQLGATLKQEDDDNGDDGDNGDDNIPLALLQIQRGSRGRDNSSQLSSARSEHPSQPQPTTTSLRHQGSRSPLPAFARRLPHDPFPGRPNNVWPMNNQQLVPGGLVGVIASEERAKAMRRIPPSHGFQPIPDTNNAFHWTGGSFQEPGMPLLYGVPGVQQSMPYSRPQTPVAVPQPQPPTHHMFNFLQAQTEFLRTMASMSQQRSHKPWDGYIPQQSTMRNNGLGAESAYAPSNYAMSTCQTSMGYATSVAPSERNNIGLPSRYRPVSKVATQIRHPKQTGTDDAATLKDWGAMYKEEMDATSILPDDSTDDDDDDAFWKAKKAKRDRRRAVWIGERDLGIKPEWII